MFKHEFKLNISKIAKQIEIKNDNNKNLKWYIEHVHYVQNVEPTEFFRRRRERIANDELDKISRREESCRKRKLVD